MADLKVTWKPRQWLKEGRFLNTYEVYKGDGFIVGEDVLCTLPGRKFNNFATAALPANYTIKWMTKVTQTSYVALVKDNGGGGLFYLGVLTLSSWTPYTWVPGTPLDWHDGYPVDFFYSFANSAYYVTTQSHGLVKMNIGVNTVTATPGASGVFSFVPHLARLIGVSVGGVISWSDAGNYDNWTTGSSGSVTLPEANMVAVRVVDRVVIVLGFREIYAGYPTGVSLPAYRFEQILANTDVAKYNTVAQYENVLYYVGFSGPHKFERMQQTAINGPFMNILKRPEFVRSIKGSVTLSLRKSSTLLVEDRLSQEPMYVVLFNDSVDHDVYAYNINKGIWQDIIPNTSVDVNAGPVTNNYLDIVSTTTLTGSIDQPGYIEFLNDDGVRTEYLTDNVNPDIHAKCRLQSGAFLVGDPERVYTLEKMCFKYAVNDTIQSGALRFFTPNVFQIVYVNREDAKITTNQNTFNFYYSDSYENITQAVVKCVEKAITGQYFECNFEFYPVMTRVDLFEIDFYFIDAGEWRGVYPPV